MRHIPSSASRALPSVAVRQNGIVLGRRALLSSLAGGAALVLWAGAATFYILCRDDLAQRFFAQETEMKYAYEDRIGDLSGRLRREITQNLVERNGVEGRFAVLAARQAEIESRQAWLKSAAERALGSASLPSPPVLAARPGVAEQVIRLDDAARRAASGEKPTPLSATDGLRLRDASGQPTGEPARRDRVSVIEQSIDAVEVANADLARALGASAKRRLAHLQAAVAMTGINLGRHLPAPSGEGGPLVPLPKEATVDGFGFLSADLEAGLGELDALSKLAARLPLRSPLAGELDQTSPFGYRLDPFTRTPALHTGVDYRAEWGAPVHATAAGRVTIAEATGGYGNMIEVDHGGGVVTRYGHLSAYLVAPGDRIEAGQVIGRVGSTGRSTGSHLHYETRVDGEPVNAARFIAAGRLAQLGNG